MYCVIFKPTANWNKLSVDCYIVHPRLVVMQLNNIKTK